MHRYVETALCERFTNAMVTAWYVRITRLSIISDPLSRVSATNSARMYNMDTEDSKSRFPDSWDHSVDMTTESVWDAFFLNALLLDCKEHLVSLELPHNAHDHSVRLRVALVRRNERMVGPGQELWNHACELCCETDEDGTREYPLECDTYCAVVN